MSVLARTFARCQQQQVHLLARGGASSLPPPSLGCLHLRAFASASDKAPKKSMAPNKDSGEEMATFDLYKEAARQPKHPFKEQQTQEMINTAKETQNYDHLLPHPIWSDAEVSEVKVTHRKPEGVADYMAYYAVLALRTSFDICSGYTIGKELKTLDERAVLKRCVFLETVAGVPGFAAAMIRHLNSLRRMERDHGWIHTLLEEAENERMHLMTFMTLMKPGIMFRTAVVLTQWAFIAGFSTAYIFSPKFCHRFVGYLEEQAVVTYTHVLEEIDKGSLPMWTDLKAPPIAINYWQLGEKAMMRDVILAIRADEAHHRVVNHTLGSMNLKDANPFEKGK